MTTAAFFSEVNKRFQKKTAIGLEHSRHMYRDQCALVISRSVRLIHLTLNNDAYEVKHRRDRERPNMSRSSQT